MKVLSDGVNQMSFDTSATGAAKARDFIKAAEAAGRSVSDKGTGGLGWLSSYEEGRKISLF